MKPYITYSTLTYVATRCDEYKQQYGKWPDTLSELRRFKVDLPSVSIDAWGRDLAFIPYDETVGYGRLISYGADGTIGGNSEMERDQEIRFPMKENDAWNEKTREGAKQPKSRFYGLFPYLPK